MFSLRYLAPALQDNAQQLPDGLLQSSSRCILHRSLNNSACNAVAQAGVGHS